MVHRFCVIAHSQYSYVETLNNAWVLQNTSGAGRDFFVCHPGVFVNIDSFTTQSAGICPRILTASPAVIILLQTQRPEYSRKLILQSIPKAPLMHLLSHDRRPDGRDPILLPYRNTWAVRSLETFHVFIIGCLQSPCQVFKRLWEKPVEIFS